MRVIIAGGGNVGTYIAGELHNAGHEVLVAEQDPDRVAWAGRQTTLAGGITWLEVDACEVSQFGKCKPETADVVVAVTGDDEDNLVVSLLAKQEFGVPRVVARINNPNNEWMFNETWGVDVSVSTPHLLTALVEEAVSVGSLVRILSFEGGHARLAEVKLADTSPAIGHDLQHLEFPRGSTVVAVIREEHLVVPRGDTVFHEGDEVMVLVTDDSEDKVRSLLVG
ncbi:MAG: TrkA family potassium uptake protein [Actinobacteria bacterium]|nr:TrkA family potassium uptake protein [Actinomycetota bacterium]